jgi:hypothetical protein
MVSFAADVWLFALQKVSFVTDVWSFAPQMVSFAADVWPFAPQTARHRPLLPAPPPLSGLLAPLLLRP